MMLILQRDTNHFKNKRVETKKTSGYSQAVVLALLLWLQIRKHDYETEGWTQSDARAR